MCQFCTIFSLNYILFFYLIQDWNVLFLIYKLSFHSYEHHLQNCIDKERDSLLLNFIYLVIMSFWHQHFFWKMILLIVAFAVFVFFRYLFSIILEYLCQVANIKFAYMHISYFIYEIFLLLIIKWSFKSAHTNIKMRTTRTTPGSY